MASDARLMPDGVRRSGNSQDDTSDVGGLQATGSIAPLAQFRMVLVSFLAAGIGSEAPILPADMRIKELADRIARHDPEVSRHQGMLIVDREGKLAGVVTRGDILRAG
jgi:CBS domain-containing protein